MCPGAAHHIFLLPCNLTWRLEVDSQYDIIRFFSLCDVLDRRNMKGHSEPVYRQDNGLLLLIHIHLPGLISFNVYKSLRDTHPPVLHTPR
jgi:hypothetical protein